MTLEQLLESADETKPPSILAFYQGLLVAEVLVPRSPAPKLEELGAIDAYGFLIAGEGDNRVLPVFTSAQALHNWCGEDAAFEKYPFLTLARLAPISLTIHLNPGAEIGKEFSYWELEKLLHGTDALEDLVFEICDGTESRPVEDRELPEEIERILPRWKAAFESYACVDEAYCAVIENESGEQILLGYSAADCEEEIRKRIEEELQSSMENPLGLRVVLLSNTTADPLSALIRQGELIYQRSSERDTPTE